MSKLFCCSPELCLLERQMQQPPGYRPRKIGIYIVQELDWKERGSYSKILDSIISQIQMERLKNRIQNNFTDNDREKLFRDERHCNKIMGLKNHIKGKYMGMINGYAAAVYLLTADEKLWEKVGQYVLESEICFDRVRLGHVTLEQYILFHAAKDVYQGTKHIRLSELVDAELISDEMFRLIVNAFVVEKFGIHIIWEAWNEHTNF